jgi:glyoxylase-like metal-dependent hydrolase (beta-lactamase superfamily II)
MITPDVHAVHMRGANAFLIVEDRLSLIDAGLPGSRGRLERYIARLGRSLGELDRIICTHGHPDHVGGARELAAGRAEVLLHPDDAEAIRSGIWDALRSPSRGRFFAALSQPPLTSSPLIDGQILPVLGGLEVVHTPGHTPGSVCFYARRDRLLFTGDVLEVRRGRVTFASSIFSTDVRAARQSTRRLADLDVETIVFSHFPPWRTDAAAVLRELSARAVAP